MAWITALFFLWDEEKNLRKTPPKIIKFLKSQIQYFLSKSRLRLCLPCGSRVAIYCDNFFKSALRHIPSKKIYYSVLFLYISVLLWGGEEERENSGIPQKNYKNINKSIIIFLFKHLFSINVLISANGDLSLVLISNLYPVLTIIYIQFLRQFVSSANGKLSLILRQFISHIRGNLYPISMIVYSQY